MQVNNLSKVLGLTVLAILQIEENDSDEFLMGVKSRIMARTGKFVALANNQMWITS